MSDIILYVPVVDVNSRESSLYTVTSTPSSDSWYVNGIIEEKMEACEPWFLRYLKPQELGAQLIVNNPDEGKLEDLVAGKHSVLLGLLLGFIRHLLHWQIKKDWESVTITGNIEPHGNTIGLLSIDDIPEKYKAATVYAKNNPGNHLFLYVSDTVKENECTSLEKIDTLKVKFFTSKDSIYDVLEYLLDIRQLREKTPILGSKPDFPFGYIRTQFFSDIKQGIRENSWKGFFIHGEGERGKSALAEEIAHQACFEGIIDVAVWIEINNGSLSNALMRERENLKLEAHEKDAVTREIESKIQAALGTESLKDSRYLLIIDNLEKQSLIDPILQAVKGIIRPYGKQKPRVIITSRVDSMAAQLELGLLPQEAPEFTAAEIERFIEEICQKGKYANKLTLYKGTDDYKMVVDLLYTHLRSFPGMIPPLIAHLKFKKLHEILPLLRSLGQGVQTIDEKAAKIYGSLFNDLSLFVRKVLFILIKYSYENDTGAGAKEIISLFEGDIQAWHLVEDVPKAMETLEQVKIIIQSTSEKETKYAIKSLTLLTFTFADGFDEPLRAGILSSDLRLRMSLYYDFPAGRIEPLLKDVMADQGSVGDRPLILAAQQSSRPETIELSLSYGANIHAQNNDGFTPLHWAAYKNQNPEILETLFKHNANIHAQDNDGGTPLHLTAYKNQNPEILETLLRHNANIHAQDNNGWTPLHWAAAYNQNPEILETLLRHNANIHAQDNNGLTPLHWAVYENQNPEILETLLRHNANIHAQDNDGRTPLHRAAGINENPEILETLLRHNANIHAQDNDGRTPLHQAAAYNQNPEILETLLRHNANIHAQDNDGRTPLHRAAGINENPEILETLLRYNANIHAQDNDGRTPLHRAASNNKKPEILETLLRHNANIHAQDNDGRTPLHRAACNNKKPEILETLLRHNANIHAQDNDGRTPLHWAVCNNEENPEWHRVLIHKVYIYAQGNDCWNPLHWAAYKNQITERLKTLFKHDAALIHAAAARNQNAEILETLRKYDAALIRAAAARNQNAEILEILLRHNADIHAQDNNGRTPLHWAAYKNQNPEILKTLLKHDAALIYSQDNYGRTPLHYAAWDNQNPEILETLLKHDAALIHTPDNDGDTPLHCAASNNEKPQVVISLIRSGANLDVKNKAGETPLEYINKREDQQVIKDAIK
ncbi:hypothetical protein FACS1894200_00030 [Spirochaetia bacterium]|nr:hypothetical protein FACS1894200_00030 [Spirochaetia bacterium]